MRTTSPCAMTQLGLRRKCETGGRASLLLTVFVILFVLVLVALFAREWTLPGDEGDQGSGYMTKAKIVITHIQVCTFLGCPASRQPVSDDVFGF